MAIAEILSVCFVSTEGETIELKGRGCKERMERLLLKYRAEDARSLKRSGTEEEYTELNQLLEDIFTYRRDQKELKLKESKQRNIEDEKKKANQMRQAAVEGMAKRKHESSSSCPSTSTISSSDDDEGNETDSGFQIEKKAKVCTKQNKRASKLSAVEMLSDKYEMKAKLKEKELAVRKLELDLNVKKLEIDMEERKQRLALEMEERKAILKLIRDEL